VTAKLPAGQVVLAGAGFTGTDTITFDLDAGDVAQLVAPAGEDHDLSGALVTASKPVQVLTGTPCSYGGSASTTCDHVEESVFPAETLGRHYVAMPPTSPGGKVVGHIVRFYGNADGTKLDYLPARPAGCPETLAAGQVAQCTNIVDAAFEVTGDHEFAVGSQMLASDYQDPGAAVAKGDPSLTLVTGVEQYRTDYIFLAPSDFDESYVDVVAPADATITLDGASLAATATPLSSQFVAFRKKLEVTHDGAHVLLATKPVGVQVVGFGAYASYAYPGGLDLRPIAPPPVK